MSQNQIANHLRAIESQPCFVDGGGQLAEVCTREVLKDILHIAVSNQRQDAPWRTIHLADALRYTVDTF